MRIRLTAFMLLGLAVTASVAHAGAIEPDSYDRTFTQARNISAFAALKNDGSVQTFGEASRGGNSSAVTSRISSGVVGVYSAGQAFAALKNDGSVVTWGYGGTGRDAGGGNSSAVAGQLTSGVKKISSTPGAFAAIKYNGSVVAWGGPTWGGDPGNVGGSGLVTAASGSLSSGVLEVYATNSAFAARKSDGSVVTWGGEGGTYDHAAGADSSAVASQLSSGVTAIATTRTAFAALKSDGSVVAWGWQDSGGDPSYGDPGIVAAAPAGSLSSGVTRIFASDDAFAALKNDGTVVTWGHWVNGGDSSTVAGLNTGSAVTRIFSTHAAFAALKADGSVIVWGDTGCGGDATGASLGSGVADITTTYCAFAARKTNGSVTAWGNATDGGNITNSPSTAGVTAAVGSTSSGVVSIAATAHAFAALKNDGSVVTWGSTTRGGSSSGVAAQLTGAVTQIAGVDSAFAAVKSNGSVVQWGNITPAVITDASSVTTPFWQASSFDQTISTLDGITVNSGALSPAFASGTNAYAADVSYDTTSISVTPTASDITATITVNGSAVATGAASAPIVLAVGANAISIVVTAPDGTTTRTYTVTVTRAAAADTGVSSAPDTSAPTTSRTGTTPSASFTASTPVRFDKTVITRVTVSGPGSIRQIGTFTTRRGGAACRITRTVKSAGTYTLKCRLASATGRLRLVTTFTPKGGKPSSLRHTVRLS